MATSITPIKTVRYAKPGLGGFHGADEEFREESDHHG
jgi:hypothetical protein